MHTFLNQTGLLITPIFFLLLLPHLSISQTVGPVPEKDLTLRQNSNSTLEASADRVWAGPGLNSIDTKTGEITVPVAADSVFNGRGRVFSLSVQNQRVLAGLGFTSEIGENSVNAAMGYYQTENSGDTWRFIPFPLDEPATDPECSPASVGPPCDIEFEYGDTTYIRTRITVPEQSPPFEVDFSGETLLSANWASGVLRSFDNGNSWERLVLPPSGVMEMQPGDDLSWTSRTPEGEVINRYDPRFDNNLLGFGLLIDKQERVWVGTAGGINISGNALTAPRDQISWKRVAFDADADGGLLSNWIIAIRRQPETDRIWMTNWRTDPLNRDQFGIVYTEDGGRSFRQFLEGVKVNDIGFWKGDIFAAADGGLYISRDDGNSWSRLRQIESNRALIGTGARFFAITSSEDKLWVGTSGGIASTDDGGDTWEIFRVDVPLRGGNVYQPDAPDVETYAYPNPFSPALHRHIRIKYRIRTPGQATIRIFDFGMNPVHTIRVNRVSTPGAYESLWNGRSSDGRILSNGTYFYDVKTADGSSQGKILLLE